MKKCLNYYDHQFFLKKMVWMKGAIISGRDPRYWRYDIYGNIIFFLDYGNRQSLFGWEIDHIFSKSHGGTNALANLQPLQWVNNLLKSNYV